MIGECLRCGCTVSHIQKYCHSCSIELKQLRVEMQKDKDQKGDWKDFDISNVPSDMFVNKRYQFRCVTISGEKDTMYDLHERYLLINDSRCNKYRYRLKPLESIRITRSLLNILIENHKKYGLELPENEEDYRFEGRPVEIIEDDI